MKILAIYYSQTGQLEDIIKNFASPFDDVEYIKVKPKNPFEFPWNSKRFYDAMPESVLEIPSELEEIHFKEEHYDLILLGYQPWFLSPSIPATSIFSNIEFTKKLQNTKVITIIGARNMWLNAQESIKKMLALHNANLIGNLPLVDKSPNIFSAMSIVHWMMSGKKTRKWGVLPKPGISDADISGATNFGILAKKSAENDDLNNLQSTFVNNNGVIVKTPILFIESKAKKIFLIWLI